MGPSCCCRPAWQSAGPGRIRAQLRTKAFSCAIANDCAGGPRTHSPSCARTENVLRSRGVLDHAVIVLDRMLFVSPGMALLEAGIDGERVHQGVETAVCDTGVDHTGHHVLHGHLGFGLLDGPWIRRFWDGGDSEVTGALGAAGSMLLTGARIGGSGRGSGMAARDSGEGPPVTIAAAGSMPLSVPLPPVLSGCSPCRSFWVVPWSTKK